jgi:YD repeat-containing protein
MINDAFEYCNYATFTCSGNHPWPSLSYSMTEVTLPSGRPGTVTMITDQQGASFRHETTRFASDFKVFKSGVGSPLAIHYANNQGGGGRDGPSLPGYIEHTGANGIRYNYQYSDVSTPSGLEVRGTRTSSDGRVYSFVGNPSIPKSSVVVQETDEIGRVTNFTYDNRRRPLEIKFPEGNSENYTYDQNGNITEIRRKSKPGSGIADIVKTIGYPSPCSGPLLCNKPTSIVDERGGLTNYSWDPVTGNLLTHSLPADANGIRPVKRYLYANMYAWVSNGSGGFVQSAAPRSMLTEERSCLTTATIGTSCAGGAADEVVTAYYYGPPSGPNNLLLKGKSTTAGGVTLVECYGYDKLGNKISTTKPNANLQVCP